MEKRKAYDLRELLIVYNFALVLLSAWMAYEVSAVEVSLLSFFLAFMILFSFADTLHDSLSWLHQPWIFRTSIICVSQYHTSGVTRNKIG